MMSEVQSWPLSSSHCAQIASAQDRADLREQAVGILPRQREPLRAFSQRTEPIFGLDSLMRLWKGVRGSLQLQRHNPRLNNGRLEMRRLEGEAKQQQRAGPGK